MKRNAIGCFLAAALILLSGCAVPAQGTGTNAAAAVEETLPVQAAPGEASQLTVHFLDVGQADCALVESGGEYLLIDGGNREDSRMVVSYLEQQGVEELEAVICTHPHEDHAGGLPGVLAVYPTQAVYAPTATYASDVYDDFLYYTDQQGLEVTIPAPGDTISLGETVLTVLGPVQSYAETNDTSIVLRAELGQMAFLFTGDMETAAEGDMLDYWDSRMDWDCDVLKVGHHGSDTSTGYRLLRETAPEYAVISVGRDNAYGHPHEEPLSRLEQAGARILRTDQLGWILARSDGETVTFTWENQASSPEEVPGQTEETVESQAAEIGYIGNRNSKKFHLPTCASLPKPQNQVPLDSYEAALEAGYIPCKNCLE